MIALVKVSSLALILINDCYFPSKHKPSLLCILKKRKDNTPTKDAVQFEQISQENKINQTTILGLSTK